MSKTEPICFRLDETNKETTDEMAKDYGIKKRAAFIRHRWIELCKEWREKKLK